MWCFHSYVDCIFLLNFMANHLYHTHMPAWVRINTSNFDGRKFVQKYSFCPEILVDGIGDNSIVRIHCGIIIVKYIFFLCIFEIFFLTSSGDQMPKWSSAEGLDGEYKIEGLVLHLSEFLPSPNTYHTNICVSKCLCILYPRPGIDFVFFIPNIHLYIIFLYGYRILFVVQDYYLKNENNNNNNSLHFSTNILTRYFCVCIEYYVNNISWYLESGKFNF